MSAGPLQVRKRRNSGRVRPEQTGDRRLGPIHDKWNVHKWLTAILLDRNGIIRHRDLRGRELNDALEALLRE